MFSAFDQTCWWNVTFHIGFKYRRSFCVFDRVWTVKIFSSENHVREILTLVDIFKCLHAVNRSSLSAADKSWSSWRRSIFSFRSFHAILCTKLWEMPVFLRLVIWDRLVILTENHVINDLNVCGGMSLARPATARQPCSQHFQFDQFSYQLIQCLSFPLFVWKFKYHFINITTFLNSQS